MTTEYSLKRLVCFSVSISLLIACTSNGQPNYYEALKEYDEDISTSDPVYNAHVTADTVADTDKSQSEGPYGMDCWLYGQARATVTIDADGDSGEWSAYQYSDVSNCWDHYWEWTGNPGSEPVDMPVTYGYSGCIWATSGGKIYYPEEGSATIAGDSDVYACLSHTDTFYASGEAEGWATNDDSWNDADVYLDPEQEEGWDIDLDNNPYDSEYGALADIYSYAADGEYETSYAHTFYVTTTGGGSASVSGYLDVDEESDKYLDVLGRSYWEVSGYLDLDY